MNILAGACLAGVRVAPCEDPALLAEDVKLDRRLLMTFGAESGRRGLGRITHFSTGPSPCRFIESTFCHGNVLIPSSLLASKSAGPRFRNRPLYRAFASKYARRQQAFNAIGRRFCVPSLDKLGAPKGSYELTGFRARLSAIFLRRFDCFPFTEYFLLTCRAAVTLGADFFRIFHYSSTSYSPGGPCRSARSGCQTIYPPALGPIRE